MWSEKKNLHFSSCFVGQKNNHRKTAKCTIETKKNLNQPANDHKFPSKAVSLQEATLLGFSNLKPEKLKKESENKNSFSPPALSGHIN